MREWGEWLGIGAVGLGRGWVGERGTEMPRNVPDAAREGAADQCSELI